MICVVLACAVILATDHAAAPTPMVERIVVTGGRQTRLTLFDNGVAVVSVREGDRQGLFRKRTLDGQEYNTFHVAVVREVPELGSRDQRPPFMEDATRAVVWIHQPGQSLIRLVYYPAKLLDLPTARLVATLDDLERLVSETSPSYDALRAWEPQLGDRVELFGGPWATVMDVLPGGIVKLLRDDAALIEVVTPEHYADVIKRVVEEEE